MKLYYAPMEGITNWWFRRLHQQYFGGVDQYYTWFLAPTEGGIVGKALREADPEHNAGVPVVLQTLTNRADAFLGFCRAAAALGYTEVNLNLGCPSGTVVSKGRGAGFLAHPEELERFLEQVFSGTDLAISLKTRLGMEHAEEFAPLLAIYNRYPAKELIVHPRVRRDFYKNHPNWDAFALAAEQSRAPVCYNGDIFTAADAEVFRARFPQVERLMLGRGLVANPALARQLAGGAPLEKAELQAFHEAVLAKSCEIYFGERDVLFHMKELWTYWGTLFEDCGKELKRIRKAQHLSDYKQAAALLFAAHDLRKDPGYRPG